MSRCTCFVQAAKPDEDVTILLVVTNLCWQKKEAYTVQLRGGGQYLPTEGVSTWGMVHLKWSRAYVQAVSALNAELALIKLL